MAGDITFLLGGERSTSVAALPRPTPDDPMHILAAAPSPGIGVDTTSDVG